jgi:enoyl-CoA hydratase/carnithine racemase
MTETIDITPTWSALIPIMVEVLKNPKANNAAKQEVIVELKRLAKIVDDQNKKLKENDSSKN